MYQNNYYGQHLPPENRQQPTVQYIPPVVIQRYVNQWIQTFIPGYGRVIAYVLDYNERTGMVSMFMYTPPYYRRQYIQVHHSDLTGITPYFGPTPPRPRPPRPRPPRPRPPYGPGPGIPGPGTPGPGAPGPGPGHGGFFEWLLSQFSQR